MQNHPTQSNLSSALQSYDARLHIPIFKFLCSLQTSELSLLKLSFYFQHLTQLLYRAIRSHQARLTHPPIANRQTSYILSFFLQPPSHFHLDPTPTFSGIPHNNLFSPLYIHSASSSSTIFFSSMAFKYCLLSPVKENSLGLLFLPPASAFIFSFLFRPNSQNNC